MQGRRRLARRLRALGVGPDDRVALYFDRSLEMIEGLMGVMASGAAYVPLDPVYPAERIRFMLEDSGAKVVLTHSSRAADLPAGIPHVICLDGDPEPETAGHGGQALPDADPENLAYVMYTSGTTGRPKGVQIEHRQLRNYAAAVLERMDVPEASLRDGLDPGRRSREHLDLRSPVQRRLSPRDVRGTDRERGRVRRLHEGECGRLREDRAVAP